MKPLYEVSRKERLNYLPNVSHKGKKSLCTLGGTECGYFWRGVNDYWRDVKLRAFEIARPQSKHKGVRYMCPDTHITH